MHPLRSIWLLVLFAWPLWAPAAEGKLRLPAILSDHMVLLSGEPVPIWGWGRPGSQVTAALAGQTRATQVAADGKWRVVFDPLTASVRPQTLTVTSETTLTVNDVLIGEVWLAGGQSNMVLPVSRSPHYEMEKLLADLPALRMFTAKGESSDARAEDCAGEWVVCTPDNIGRFSAVAYFFGRQIHRVQRGAVGLINTAVGSTCIESWIPLAAQRATPALASSFELREKIIAKFDAQAEQTRLQKLRDAWDKVAAAAQAAGQPEPPRKPGTWQDVLTLHQRQIELGELFNGRIAPLVPFTIRGVIWYQGEGNAVPERAPLYAPQMRLLVRSWREEWGRELPFAWVQLPNMRRVESWVHIREGQLLALDQPKTGMVVSTDAGESLNIHPLNKETIGLRLAQWALGTVYGHKVCPSGPLLAGHTIRGGEVVLKFHHAQDGLTARGDLNGFAIAGADRVWHPAQARIDRYTVVVSSPDVPAPAAVRYAWKDDPPCTLYNGAGLPASPFRTDDWPLFTPPAAPAANLATPAR